MKNFAFGKYCTPAQLYLILGAIGIIIAFFNNFSIKTLLTNVLFLVIWAWVLNWLCSKGFKAISWIIVLLPFIFFLFTYFLIKDVAVKEGMMDCSGIKWVFLGYKTAKACRDARDAQEATKEAAKKAADKAAKEAADKAAKEAADKAADKATCISGCKNKKNSKACQEACPA